MPSPGWIAFICERPSLLESITPRSPSGCSAEPRSQWAPRLVDGFTGGAAPLIQRVGVLALLIFLLAATLVSLYAGSRGRYRKLRRIPGLEVINEAVGRAAEMGRGVIFSTGSGSGGLNSDSAPYHLGGINTLGYVANLARDCADATQLRLRLP